jgi:multiple antibiotic resistance protein
VWFSERDDFSVDTFWGNLATDIITLFVVFNSLGVVPVYQGLTATATESQRKMIVNRAALVVLAILFFFALIGDAVLGFLGITLHYIMVAGGLYILVFAIKSALGDAHKPEASASRGRADALSDAVAHRIAIVPLATPLLAGPGAIATVMILNDEPSGIALTLTAIVINTMLTWSILRLSNILSRKVGQSNLMILDMTTNLLTAAIGVAFILKGASAAFNLTFS